VEPGLHGFFTHEKDQREAPVNKGVSILKGKKKSNKQMIKEARARRNRPCLLTS
jgi:hypothetical protein